ncbi:hypothetical protein CCR75_005306 [Bremia lactucae]|uniref:PDZ domain-containing protein n=1 Tax=Bremia lactucae TaxID=4779 RepID=A0A976IG04_BRELC|nr:hypothetical protein CCR75_005306 [Bremia lactucae]
MEYEVLWGDGPLGLTLRPDLGEDMPPVVGRITRQDSAAALAKVAVGHMLVSINGLDTARQGYDLVVETLQKIPRPATLRFRVPRVINGASSPYREPSRSSSRRSRGSTGTTWSETGKSSSSSTSSRRREQYTVVWTEGPLGMILRPDDDDCHVPCIRKITGKGAGTGMERATMGDVLVAVNGQETKALGFRSTISLLKTIRKPAVLKFKRMGRRISRKKSVLEFSGGSRSVSGIPSEIGSYDIVWREGDLGLKLKPGYRDVPVLSKLTGKGTASGLQNAQVGDELLSVNGTAVEGEAYQDTLRMLKHSPKPAVLRFRPGRTRRESMMSAASVSSVRSNPSTQREVIKVSSRQHVPLYDSELAPVERPPSSGGMTTERDRFDRDRQKRRRRIPLDVARELVAASQGSDLDHAIFAGIPITAIEEGSKEAHLLRVQAKLCISNQVKTERVTPAKEALSRAEQEARVLQEALEKVKSQAKKYEEILEAQSRERVLALAVRHKPEEVVKRQNNVISELAGVISGFKRDDYADVNVVPPPLREANVQKIMDDLQTVMSIPVVVPTAKFCAECGTTENESKLDMDDDGEFYCKDCWDKFLNHSGLASAATASTILTKQAHVVEDEQAVGAEASLMHEMAMRAATSRMTMEAREAEEVKARMEAERKLLEIHELRRSGSMMPERSHKNTLDRSRRERRGLEELAQALLEEEERARAEGNLKLAKKLHAQRARTMAESLSPGTALDAGIIGTVPDDMEPLNGHRSPSTLKLTLPIEETTLVFPELPSSSIPVVVSPAASPELMSSPVSAIDSDMATAVTNTSLAADTVPLNTSSLPPASTGGNDYADVNSDEEAEDQMHLNDEEDVLREVEEKNFALARQLDEAHSVIERARMSITMAGEDDDDEVDDGLSEEQISLFKKLTNQAEERMSMVDRLHPQDDSDSDSDSDEEEEADDGVWI